MSNPTDYIDDQGFWCCGKCKGKGSSQKEQRFYSVGCACWSQPEAHYLDFTPAFCIALKLASAGGAHLDVTDSCSLCDPDHTSIKQFIVCTNCGKESCYGHEMNVLKYFQSKDTDQKTKPTNQELRNDTSNRLRRSPRTGELFYQPAKRS